MSYQVEVDPETRRIIVTGESLTAFNEVPEAVHHDGSVELPFTTESARLLHAFLSRNPHKLSLQTKTYLRLLYNGQQDAQDWTWNLPLKDLRENINNSRSKLLRTEWDLIHYMPIRYIDKSNPQNIADLKLDQWCTIIGTVASITYNKKAEATIVVVKDSNGATVEAWFFRQAWLLKKFRQGGGVVLSGKFTEHTNKYTGAKTLRVTSPTLDYVSEYQSGHKILPVYSERSTAATKANISRQVETLLNTVAWVEDPVPDVLLEKYEFMSRNEAYRKVHFPDTLEEAAEARRRIAFDDFVRLQVFLLNRKRAVTENAAGVPMTNSEWLEQYINSLPYNLTGAQQRVLTEITEDMSAPHPMRRLLHGDVGSGKTEVATAAALQAVRSGQQVAILAPTVILAQQLFERIHASLENANLPVTAELLYPGMKAKPRRELIAGVAEGSINILIGTHGILSKTIQFEKLGLVIIDEQHKFGNKHRQQLNENQIENTNIVPDVLMMSATPIPRTMSAVIFGDMNISVLDEHPEGRKPIETYWDGTSTDNAYARIREEVAKGHQAYVLTSLVDESESERLQDIENATATQQFLQTQIFPTYTVGLVHGRMTPEEKTETLQRYYDNEIQILVSTSVVEVGVNVPNATVMTILDANRFGIASLHQIRGRVGRGNTQGYCYLVGEATTPEAEDRLHALVASNDGFWLAEQDLEIRGEGSMIKDTQHGDNDLMVANLREYKSLLEVAKRVAEPASRSPKMQEEVEYIYGNSTIAV